LADKYSALTEKRVYKDAMTPKQALTVIYSEVKDGKIERPIFNALVKSVQAKESAQIVNKY
jgi:HD-GYP domain-containing protein (c-di-GMP phosphodiesterase class II)